MKTGKNIQCMALALLLFTGYTPGCNAMFARVFALVSRYSSHRAHPTSYALKTPLFQRSMLPIRSLISFGRLHSIGIARSINFRPQFFNHKSNEHNYHCHNHQKILYTSKIFKDLEKQDRSGWLLGMGCMVATLGSQEDEKTEPEKKQITQDQITREAELLALEIFAKIGISCPDPDVMIEDALKDLNYEQQDQFLSAMMERLLDEHDTRNFKPIARLALILDKVWEKHPKLHKLIRDHAEKPMPSTFITTFISLSIDDLPHIFAYTFKSFNERVSTMGWTYYIVNFIRPIYRKF